MKFNFTYCRIILITLVFLLVSFPSAAQEKEAGEYLKIADKYYKEKNYREALGNYKNATEKNSGSVKAYLGLARSSVALNSRADAEFAFKKVLELDSKNKEAIAGLAEVFADNERFDDSNKLLDAGLKDEPYNPFLLLARASVLLKMKKGEQALLKLEDAGRKIVKTYEYNILLSKAYTSTGRFKKASEVIAELLSRYPENADPYYQKANLNFEMISNGGDKNPDELIAESYSLLTTALSLEPGHIDSKRLLVKSLIWQRNYEESLRYLNELLEDYPEDPALCYLAGYLNLKMSSEQQDEFEKHRDLSSKFYSKLLDLQELNEIGRFSAENFSLTYLNEHDKFRKRLGVYRQMMYNSNKSDLYMGEAFFQLKRAEKLIPWQRKLKNELLEYYHRTGDLYNTLSILERLRFEYPDEVKIQNRLENVFTKFKQSIVYREGFADNKGKINFSFRSVPEVFIFDPSNEKSFETYPDASLQISSAIKFALSLNPALKVISGEEEDSIRKSILDKKGQEKYTEAVYYSPEFIDEKYLKRKSHNFIRYILYGSYSVNKNTIKISYKLYDRFNGKIAEEIKFTSSNRHSLPELAMRVARKVFKSIPVSGKVVKINDDNLLLNIGSKDGVKKESLFSVIRENKEFAELKVVEVDEYMTLVKPADFKEWKRELSLRDNVLLKIKKDDKTKQEE